MSTSQSNLESNTNSQKKDINNEVILQHLDKWHDSFQSLLTERDELSNNIRAMGKENMRMTAAYNKNKSDFEMIHSTMKDSNAHLQTICTLEDELRQLKLKSEEKEKEVGLLKSRLAEQKQRLSEELKQTQLELANRLTKTTEKIKTEATIERELLQKQLEDRDLHLKEADENLEHLQKAKDAELSRVSLEYENKLARLQRQKTQSNQNQTSSVNSDIFRKKLQNMKVEYEGEISRLKSVISNLEEKLANALSHQQPMMGRSRTLSTEKRKRMF